MKYLKKPLFLLIALFLISFFIYSDHIYNKEEIKAEATYTEHTREYRAVWVSHFAGDISQYKDEASYKQAILTILNNMVAMNMNAIVFHVRTHNNAFYRSELNPKSRYYSNVDYDEFDPVAWIIEECHKRGIEFHAWLNPYRVSTSGNNPDYTYEELPLGNAARDSENLLTVGNNIILDPGRPAVRDFIVDTCMELIENYDVDAIDFDDYFYISGCDDSATRAIYNTKNLSVDDFRREQVSLLIKDLHDNIRAYNLANNKAVEIGISPSGVYRNGSYTVTEPTYDENGTLTYPLWSNTSGFAHYGNYLYSDTKYWIDNEWIDYITPQSYHAIKQKSSSFVNLTEWWSWCVRNKKVNLSMGIGIYMALENGSSGQNWKDLDELYNQMMNANQYDEIHGICFYKYSTFLNTGELMTSHKNALKGFWTKFVPSSVKPQYTDLPEPIVTNIERTDNTISWTACENVRGYVVWRVAAGEVVDQENINHFYKYTTDTNITVPNDEYSYYISSVNNANEFSVPLSYQQGDLVIQAEKMINQITFPITINHQQLLNNIQNLLDMMSDDAKAEIANLNIYEKALNDYLEIEAIEVVAKEFVDSLAKDVENIYLLPLTYGDYEVKWEIISGSDYYDLATGEKKVAYLGTTNVNLKYTLEKNGISYSGNFKLNVGYTKSDEIGLFYRNTPHALNIEEDPTSTGSYIGWSGVVLKFSLNNNKYVYYSVINNYHELTSSEIPKNGWSSCADIYVNVSGQTISKAASNFDVNTAAGYGYFIINASGTVRYATYQASANEMISLQNGEILFCVKYLDGLINDSVMKPASNMDGVKIELLKPNISFEYTESERIQVIEDEISKITYPVSLSEKDHILRIDSLIKRVDMDSINSVLLNQFNQAMFELNVLIEESAEIEEYRSAKIEEINNYLDLNNYSDDAIQTINSLIGAFTSDVNKKDTKDEINQLVLEYKAQLDLVITKAEEDAGIIEEVRSEAILAISEILEHLDEYSIQSQTLINNLHTEYVSLIENENIAENVRSLKAEVLAKYRNIPTLIDDVKATYLEKYNTLYASFDIDLYEQADKPAIRVLFQTYKSKIQNGKTVENIISAYDELVEKLATYQTIQEKIEALNNYKALKCSELLSLVNFDHYNIENKQIVLDIINDATPLINSASTIQKVDEIYEQACLDILAIPTDELAINRANAKDEINDFIQNHEFEKADLTKVNNEKIKAEQAIDDALTKEEIDEALNKCLENLNTILESYEQKEEEKPADKPQSKMSCFGTIALPIFAMLSFVIVFLKRKH